MTQGAGQTFSMTPLSYEVLLSLGAGPLHGYAILGAISDRAGPGGSPDTGTLYTCVRRLHARGFIEVVEEPRGRRGRTYGLTDAGRTAVIRESRRLGKLLEEAERLPFVRTGLGRGR